MVGELAADVTSRAGVRTTTVLRQAGFPLDTGQVLPTSVELTVLTITLSPAAGLSAVREKPMK